ncbi:MAG: hypothetical protein ABI551_12785 [Polyangiaceae bacterium]
MRRANDVLARIDDPPWLVTRVLAAVLDLPMLAFLFFYGMPLGLIAILFGLTFGEAYAPAIGLTTDGGKFALAVVVMMFLLLVMTFVPRVLGVYSNRRTVSKMKLVAALAARPPSSPGGPSHCRSCGAPLLASEGGTVARCNYCGTDNLVSIATKLVKAVVGRVAGLRAITEDVAASDRRARAETRRLLFAELGRYALRTLIYTVLFLIYAIDDSRPNVTAGYEAPGLGIAALVLSVFVTIFFIFRSANRKDDDGEERRKANGLPDWVRYGGPFIIWVFLYWGSRLWVAVRYASLLHHG